jgi:hypothetical protein
VGDIGHGCGVDGRLARPAGLAKTGFEADLEKIFAGGGTLIRSRSPFSAERRT